MGITVSTIIEHLRCFFEDMRLSENEICSSRSIQERRIGVKFKCVHVTPAGFWN
jgi:hypothetical protein